MQVSVHMTEKDPASNQVGSENDVVIRAQRGEVDALKTLFTAHLSTVHRFALRMCRDEDRARDVAQESLLTALKGLADYRGEAAFSTWLFTIARSHCGRIRRKSDRETLSDQFDALLESASSAEAAPDAHAAHGEVSDALESALARLDPSEREVILLRDVEGVSAKDAAQILGVSVAALKSRLHRARSSLREQVRIVVHEPATEPSRIGCPDILAALSAKLEGDLSADDCSAMQDHLARCPECASRCDSAQRLLGACASLRNAKVSPTLETLVDQTVAALVSRS